MLSLWLAQHTKRIKFGCAFNILPMWHPLRLAEEFAMADILTNGRVIFGIGKGYHTREVETFGAPMLDADANRELFEEQFEIILKSFNEESFSHKGRHYTLPPEVPYRGYQLKELTLVPRPIHRPVDVWQPIVSGSVRGLDFMAKHGIKGVILGTAMDNVDEIIHQYQETNARYGRHLRLGENIALGLWCYIDDNREKAKSALRPLFEEHVKLRPTTCKDSLGAPMNVKFHARHHADLLSPGKTGWPTAGQWPWNPLELSEFLRSGI